jgi:hypothetical protein
LRDDEGDCERDDHSLCQFVHGAIYLHAMTLRPGDRDLAGLGRPAAIRDYRSVKAE